MRGRLGVYDQLEFRCLDDWQVRRLCTFEDSTAIGTDLTPRIGNVTSVAHQPTGFGNFT